MRLLIITQAVDRNDPLLGFFHAWIEAFAMHSERVHVICLKEGWHDLPENVSVHSLGKETGRSRVKYLARFFRYVCLLRREYDAVFVHMNPEYVVLGGLLWRLWGKRIGLWYIHPHASPLLHIAVVFAHHIFSAAKESFPLSSRKLMPLGHGIDTHFFSPGTSPPTTTLRLMHVGRIARVKHLEIMGDAFRELRARGYAATFDHYGDARTEDRAYAEALSARASEGWTFHGARTAEEIRAAYRAHDVHVNATPTGSFDKAVLESMACGTITIASNAALARTLPASCRFEAGDMRSLSDALERIALMKEGDRDALRRDLRARAEKHDVVVLAGSISKHLT